MSYGFDKSNRSSFSYWFAHWCAFQMVALNCHAWKTKYLLHDWYKPWMKLFLSYDKVQMFHNKYSNHHMLWWFLNDEEPDWEAMVIDWECSRFTKHACPRNAEDETERAMAAFKVWSTDNKTVRQLNTLSGIKPDNTDFYTNPVTSNDIKCKYKIDYAEKNLKQAITTLGLDNKEKTE